MKKIWRFDLASFCWGPNLTADSFSDEDTNDVHDNSIKKLEKANQKLDQTLLLINFQVDSDPLCVE